MLITRELLAKKVLDYLNRRLSKEDLTTWAEDALIENDYEEDYFEVIADSLAKLGVINVQGFDLPIAFYLNLLIRLDFFMVFGLEPSSENKPDIVYI